MAQEKTVGGSRIRVLKGDLTAMEVEAVVFYASPDLKLGAGFGNAIAVRGGPAIQKELEGKGPVATGDAVVTGGGKLKARYIVHAVGPRFQESDTEKKLAAVTLNALRKAEEAGAKSIAFPPMGTGFYAVPLDLSARVVLKTIREYLDKGSKIEDVLVVVHDNREVKPFQSELESIH
jgi:O-acetyl-ADP-ribose deacetylase (regulator of RNase III)